MGWEVYNHYFNGRMTATSSAAAIATPLWIHSDHLGTPRAKTNSAGTRVSYDVAGPFGEDWLASGDGIRYRYTGMERDAESKLEYYGARYHDTHIGRFTSRDPAAESAMLDNPQSWNRYTYVRNNPLNLIDLEGKVPIPPFVPMRGLLDYLDQKISAAKTAVIESLDRRHQSTRQHVWRISRR